MTLTKFSFKTERERDLLSLELTSARLKLIPVHPSYAGDIFENFTADITVYMTPSPAKEIAETHAFITSSRSNMSKHQELIMLILNRETGEFLGVCGLHGRSEPGTPELGLWVKKTAHGHGFGKEAIYMLCEWALENLNCEYFVYPVCRENKPSRRIPESLHGQIDHEKIVLTPDGRKLDEVVYHVSAANLSPLLKQS